MSLNIDSVERETVVSRRDSMAMLLPCPFSYKVGDGSTKAETASDRFVLFLRAALGSGEGKVREDKMKKAFRDKQESESTANLKDLKASNV